ncbi:MAG: hypothetical protein ACREHG_06560 [Candidatus Saccharimonadales bacterium]
MIVPSKGNLNRFEDESKLPSLKPGEKAVFRILDIKYDPDTPTQLMIPLITLIRPKQRVVDPTCRTKDKIVTIAHVVEENVEGEAKLEHPKFTHSERGYRILFGDNPKDVDEYQFLKMCNENVSNEYRNKNIAPVFEEVVPKVIAEKNRTTRNLRFEAMEIAKKMKESEVREFAASMSWEQNDEVGILRDHCEDMAENTPEEFLARLKDGSREIRAAIKEAFDAEIIFYDISKKRFAFKADNSTIFAVTSRVTPKEYVNVLADFFVSDASAKNVFDLIVNRTKGKKAITEE